MPANQFLSLLFLISLSRSFFFFLFFILAPLIPRKTTVVRGYLDDRVPFPATGETTVGKRFFLFFFFFITTRLVSKGK